MKNEKKFKLVICIPFASMIKPTYKAVNKLKVHIEAKPNCIGLFEGNEYFPNVDGARNKCLGMQDGSGTKTKPFMGTPAEDYTHILWIDHDMEPTPEMFDKLYDHDLDIVAGVYMVADGTLALGAFGPESNDAIAISSFRTKELQSVAFSGFGFMLMKRGVIESLGVPPFRWEPQHSQSYYIWYPTTEDVSFGQRIRRQGYKIMVDPTIRVPHYKLVPLLAQESGVEKFAPIPEDKIPVKDEKGRLVVKGL